MKLRENVNIKVRNRNSCATTRVFFVEKTYFKYYIRKRLYAMEDKALADISEINKLYTISIDDEIHFKYIVEIFNGCFGKNYKSIYSCMKMSFCRIDDDHMVWFPKMAIIKNGKIKAPSRSKGWVNYLTDDGLVFIEEKAGDTRSGAADGDGGLPRYTFGWYADLGYYVFLGVFKADASKCRTGHFEFKRIDDRIDLRRYHSLGESRIKLPSPSVLRINETTDDAFVGSFRHNTLSAADEGFEYLGFPRKIKEALFKDGIKVYPRDRQIALNALAHAKYECEIDGKHPTFLRKNSDKTYTEPHHLIPMAFQDQFDYSLDVEENIVSLCSNCHKEIHYGKYADTLVRMLYLERIDVLRKAGIHIELEDLLKMYGY